MLRAILIYRPSSSSSVLPHARVVFLQVPSIKSPWKTPSLHRLHHIIIPEDNFDDPVRSLPTWRPLAELIALCPKRQYCLPNQLTNLKRFCSYLFYCKLYPSEACPSQFPSKLATTCRLLHQYCSSSNHSNQQWKYHFV